MDMGGASTRKGVRNGGRNKFYGEGGCKGKHVLIIGGTHVGRSCSKELKQGINYLR